MKLPALSRDQVRQVDKTAIEQFGIPGVVLMENAGRGAAEIIDRIAGKETTPATVMSSRGISN